MSSGKTTKDHKKIKKWIEERGGRPAVVRGTEDHGQGAGLLRVKFNEQEENLEDVEWDEFFGTFDEKHLAFLYQEEISGKESRFFKFIND